MYRLLILLQIFFAVRLKSYRKETTFMNNYSKQSPKSNKKADEGKMPKKRIAIFAGTFDPYTLGHLYITETACKLFDEVIICIATNPQKKARMFSKEAMQLGIKQTLSNRGIENFEVVCEDEFIPSEEERTENLYFIVRGLRNSADLEYEFEIEEKFVKEYGIETIYCGSGEALGIIPGTCSTTVRKCIENGEDISPYVTNEIEDIIIYYDYFAE